MKYGTLLKTLSLGNGMKPLVNVGPTLVPQMSWATTDTQEFQC